MPTATAPSLDVSKLTPLQKLAFDEFIESPSNERWLSLVATLRRKRHRRRKRHDAASASTSQSRSIMNDKDVAQSRDDIDYHELEKGNAREKKNPTFNNQRDMSPPQNVPQSDDASPPQAELRNDEAATTTAAPNASVGNEQYIHSIAIGGGSHDDGGAVVFIVPGANTAGKESHRSNPTARTEETMCEKETIVRPWYRENQDLVQTVLVLFAIPSVMALLAFNLICDFLGELSGSGVCRQARVRVKQRIVNARQKSRDLSVLSKVVLQQQSKYRGECSQ